MTHSTVKKESGIVISEMLKKKTNNFCYRISSYMEMEKVIEQSIIWAVFCIVKTYSSIICRIDFCVHVGIYLLFDIEPLDDIHKLSWLKQRNLRKFTGCISHTIESN